MLRVGIKYVLIGRPRISRSGLLLYNACPNKSVNFNLKYKAMKQEYTVINEIRDDSSTATECRRDIATLAALGLLDFSLISLFQMGRIKVLPDPPGELFDTHKVNTSKEAVLLGMPDGVISLGGYAATMFLAMAATRFKKQSRVLDVALGGVLLGQAAGGAYYLASMAKVQKKVCVYCLAGAVINFAALLPLGRLFKRAS